MPWVDRAPWSPACPDWEQRLLSGRTPIPDLPDEWHERAALSLRCFKRLRLPDVVGQPTIGDVAGQWWFDVVAALFGSYDESAQRRAVQEVFMLVSKKNGKSTGSAALIL